MITGTCPYKGCNGMVWTSTPDDAPLPLYQRHGCEDCKRIIWTKHSRIDPCSWTERNFLKEFRVDKKTKQITERRPPKPLTKRQKMVKALVDQAMREVIMEHLIYGTGIKYDSPNLGIPELTKEEKPK